MNRPNFFFCFISHKCKKIWHYNLAIFIRHCHHKYWTMNTYIKIILNYLCTFITFCLNKYFYRYWKFGRFLFFFWERPFIYLHYLLGIQQIHTKGWSVNPKPSQIYRREPALVTKAVRKINLHIKLIPSSG